MDNVIAFGFLGIVCGMLLLHAYEEFRYSRKLKKEKARQHF